MKTQESRILFKKNTIVELDNENLNSIYGGGKTSYFSTNSESGPLCDMAAAITDIFGL